MAKLTMPGLVDLYYDVASGIALGQRDCQEDALICDFPYGSEVGFAVLADGMGGHAAGDVASKIVVTEVFAELKLQSGDPKAMEADIGEILHDAVVSANTCIGAHTESEPETQGMGATLVAPVLMGDRLYWISVGDSLLFLFRDGTLSQLNQDHSMAPQIDYLARTGLMEAETARNHPDRNCLTSVLGGHDIAHIDCPKSPMQLKGGDIVIAASDGLQFLDNDAITTFLGEQAHVTAADISTSLLRSLEDLNDPDQDNISFCVIKVQSAASKSKPAATPLDVARDKPTNLPGHPTERKKVTIMAAKSSGGLSVVTHISTGRRA